MKLRNSFLVSISTAIILSLSLSSCDNERPASQDPQFPNHNVVDDSKPKDLNQEVKDSLQILNTKIDKISQQCQNAVDDVNKMNSKVEEVETVKSLIWIALGIGGLSLLLSIVSLSRCFAINKRVDKRRDEISSLKREKLNSSHQPHPTSKVSVPSDYERLKVRVSELEQYIKQINSYLAANRPTAISQNENKSNPPTSQTQLTGYFGNPIKAVEPYFKKLLLSKDSEARFSVDISSHKAIFKPLESTQYIETFLSSDAIRVAIEFSGNTSHPTTMKVNREGEAILKDDRWYITKKAHVNLS